MFVKLRISTVIFLLYIFIFTFFPTQVLADENFDVSYNLFYRFLESGNTAVTQTTTLTNKQTNLYATEYEIIIFGKIIGEVTGFDGKGNLQLTVNKEGENKTKIHVTFNQKSVGVGNKLTFSINYELSGLTSVVGRVKEIVIPKPVDDGSLTSYNVKISVPKIFGGVAYVKPLTTFDDTQTSYIFSFDQTQAKKGILIGFGDVNHFQFKLTYHLKNNSLINRRSEIAIPPDTLYQQVLYSSIIPKPLEVTIDKDGNFLAAYDLMPRQTFDVIVSGSVLIYTTPRNDFPENPPIDANLSGNKYWEVDSTEIKEAAKSLNTPLDIYNYVSKTLKYNYGRVNIETQRLGARAALLDPNNAICMEFTDLFIALARAKGIPAREINGYAYTSDEYLKPLSLVADVLHAWPEYWNQTTKSWVSIDPTWANTTGGIDYFNSLDFNHFVFVRRGLSSTYPPAAGSYRQETSPKDVEINLQTNLPEIPKGDLFFNVEVPKKIIAGRSQKLLINIENQSGLARYNLPIKVESAGIDVSLDKNVVNLPPFGKKNVISQITFNNSKFWGKIPIRISVGDEVKTIDIDVQPMELLYFPIYLSIFSLFLIITFIVLRKNVFKKKT